VRDAGALSAADALLGIAESALQLGLALEMALPLTLAFPERRATRQRRCLGGFVRGWRLGREAEATEAIRHASALVRAACSPSARSIRLVRRRRPRGA
jgi:hypothetical protein